MWVYVPDFYSRAFGPFGIPGPSMPPPIVPPFSLNQACQHSQARSLPFNHLIKEVLLLSLRLLRFHQDHHNCHRELPR